MGIDDLYAVLGLAPSAGPAEIKQRYRQLVKETHPDVLPGGALPTKSAQAFLSVRQAYEVLSDPRRRAEHDRQLISARHSAAWAAPAVERGHGRGPGRTADGARDFARSFLADLWPEGNLSRPAKATPPAGPRPSRPGSAQSSGPRRVGGDGPRVVELTVQQAYSGAELNLGELRVRIPPGARHEMRFKVPPPIWEVETHIKRDPRFTVRGDDLEVQVRVLPKMAASGGELRVPHPAGPLLTTLPAGLRDGQALRLRGRGMPATATRQAGDLVIRVRSA